MQGGMKLRREYQTVIYVEWLITGVKGTVFSLDDGHIAARNM